MVENPMFDVFLAHNSVDKPQVRVIASELRRRGLNPWLDEEQIAPGESFQDAIQKAIPQIKSAAICIGSQGLGKWQLIELQTLISQFIERDIRVIPVLLPGVDKIPDNLLFLQQFNWVSFESIDDAAALDNLEWGIRLIKPSAQISEEEAKRVKQPNSYNQLERRLTRRQFIYITGFTTAVIGSVLLFKNRIGLDEPELLSSGGFDYHLLKELLEAEQWKRASQETTKAILLVASREKKEGFRSEDIDNFPCEDLRTINQLWLHYSKGEFGFSVQNDIYLSIQKNIFQDLSGRDIWNKFGEEVGWKEPGGRWILGELRSGVRSLEEEPRGHWPDLDVLYAPGVGYHLFLSRAQTCKL